jgi:glutamate dehydrogenase (NADP+)
MCLFVHIQSILGGNIMSAQQYVSDVFEKVVKRNPNEPEFHQAIKEV